MIRHQRRIYNPNQYDLFAWAERKTRIKPSSYAAQYLSQKHSLPACVANTVAHLAGLGGDYAS